MNEFELIRRYFSFSVPTGDDTGVGDDCALITPAAGHQLAVTTDTLVEGVHFPVDADPDRLARRALRVNLSDLAAMGAEPVGATLAITLPEVDEAWLEAFGAALAQDCEHYGCPLLGGDTTRGPLSLTPTLLGRVPRGEALLRSGAAAGDRLYVTGTLGDARAGLECLQAGDTDDALLARYWLPSPRLAAGVLLRRFASAALDVSDGLLQDAGHIAAASDLVAEIQVDEMPLSEALRRRAGEDRARLWGLTGGDDYELCFTVPPAREGAMCTAMAEAGHRVTAIGVMRAAEPDGERVRCLDRHGEPVHIQGRGYEHFA